MDEAKKDTPEVKAEPVKDAPVPAPAPSPVPTKESKLQEILAVVEEVLEVAGPFVSEILHTRATKTSTQLEPLAKKLQKLQAAHAAAKK